jgi:hypothetical protein
MPLAKDLITWGEGADIPQIKEAYEKIAPLVALDIPDAITRAKIKKLMKEALPDYEIKCDEENNSPEVIDNGNVMVRVSKPTFPSGSFNYIDVIF